MVNLKNKNKAFTLIELLVVLIIISLITVVTIYSLTKAQRNSRDTRRKADISTIQGALESYYTQNKAYPVSDDTCDDAVGWSCDYQTTAGNSIWIPDLGSVVDRLGKDPLGMKSGVTASAEGPIKASESAKHYYGYYSKNIAANLSCTTNPSCPYNDTCVIGYTEGQYYVLSAILENQSDSASIGNSSNTYNLNCDIMTGDSDYNQNAYIKIKYF